MFEAFLNSFTFYDLDVIIALLIGSVAGIIVGIVPGVGGLFLLAFLLPFTYTMDAHSAFALLLSATATVGTSNTVTSILFGVPGTAGGVAVMFDGKPLADKGRANEAMAATFVSSAIAGVFGVIVIALILPFMRPIILLFGPAEFFILVLVAIVLMAYAVEGDPIKSLLSGGLGLMASYIGLEGSTGNTRYTFDVLYLWDGLKIVPVIIGLFAVTEMMLLLEKGNKLSGKALEASKEKGGTRRGVIAAFRHWRTMLQSSFTGVWIGLLPGVGGETAQFLSYAQAQKTSKRGKYFGTGEIEGVIAADASTSSKDGASLLPTLLFGIPGSAQMAILLAAFLIFGIQPGPKMVTEQADVTYFLLFTLVIANVFATLVCLWLARHFASLARIKSVYLVASILVMSLVGAYTTTNNIGDIVVAIVFGFIGYAMVKTGMSRATFIIGAVLGPLLEQNFTLAHQIFGWGFLGRPIVLILILAMVGTVAWYYIKGYRKKKAALVGTLGEESISEEEEA